MEDGNINICSVRTTAKKMRILVGDKVVIEPNEYDKGKYIISRVMDRKNSIPRPPLANIDKLLIVIAPKPEPDLELVDKLIIYCMTRDIEPIIVVNKQDIASEEFLEEIKAEYYFLKIYSISATLSVGIDELRKELGGCISALCGQSAVGKSSFLNALIPDMKLSTQGLSRKIDRGKHTTRVNELYIYNDIMIADTPGFSSLDLLDIEYTELPLFYPEFDKYLDGCRYLDCSHIKEGKDCVIVDAVEKGLINKNRYLRYCNLYRKLKEAWEKKYD